VNIVEYISSGILESYALGELTEAERLEVERNLAQYPELRNELAVIEETMEVFFMEAGRKPRSAVKEKISSSIKRKEGTAKLISIDIWKYATAASVVIAFTSIYMAYSFWNNWKETEASLVELRALNEQVARDYNQVNQRIDALENEMQIIGNPAFERVVMNGTANAPGALASVYWNRNSQEVYLSIQNLKGLAQDQQYQLWAIVDGKPMDMGVFDGPSAGTGIAGLIKMKTIGKAAAFAVTIEPRGGKPTPSTETMQVLGNT
jgi:anti-sigma-K factor RskA